MKRYNNLYKKIIDLDNLKLAHHNAQKGKKHYPEIQKINNNENHYLDELYQMLNDKTFTTSQYKVFKIIEPKERLIYKLPYFPDRIVQHAIMQILQPIWDKTFIFDSYAAVPGKGIHAGYYRLQQFLNNNNKITYCLKMDIKKFYPNVNHDILLSIIKKKIKCKNTLWILEDIIRSVTKDKGIPIGNYLSQYFSNIYLNEFDHWIKEELKYKYYIRYCDDAVILSDNKNKLQIILAQITTFLENYKLILNKKTQIFPINSRGIDFLGYKTYHTFSLLRKSSANKFKLKLAYIKKNYKKLNSQHIVSAIMSYIGWLCHCDSYNLLKKYIFNDYDILFILRNAMKKLNINNNKIILEYA